MRNLFKTILFLMALQAATFWVGCGGGHKLVGTPARLGWVPFADSSRSAPPEVVNREIYTALDNSGSFMIHSVDSNFTIWNLERMTQFQDSSIQYILTGSMVSERQYFKKGTRIPFLVYAPKVVYEFELYYRLYNAAEKKWEDISELTASSSQRAGYQFLEFKAVDPDLSISAPDRQFLRKRALRALSDKLVRRLEKRMNIK
ncbi:MAG: hypothetical protein Kow0037_17030 [Calditrichia bacterium]